MDDVGFRAKDLEVHLSHAAAAGGAAALALALGLDQLLHTHTQ